MMGRKLRIMTVEKGLLRETKVVQKMVDSLCDCRVCISFFPLKSPTFLTHYSSISII